jgi:transcriptional antiterminator NusG
MTKKETKDEKKAKQSAPKAESKDANLDKKAQADDVTAESDKDNEVKEEYGVDFDKKTNKKGDKYRWYIINGASGQENRIANLLETRVKANELEDDIPNIVVPTQEKIVIKKGKKQTVEERIFPGYILVKMVANDDTLHLIRNTDGVIGFIGSTSKAKRPSPLSEKEVESILAFMKVKQPAVFRSSFIVNDAVKVEEGPFKEFVGTVQEVNEAKGQVTVLISMFGREVPVQLDFLQVTKI